MPTSTLAHTELLELEKPSTHGATSSHRPKTTLLHSGPTAGFAIAKMAATTIAAPKNTAFQVLALPLSNASQGVTQRKRPNNRFTLSGQELMRGLASLVFVSMIVLRDWWEPVPGNATGMSVRSSAGIHRLGIGVFRQKTRVDRRCVACPETIAAGTRMQRPREPHRFTWALPRN